MLGLGFWDCGGRPLPLLWGEAVSEGGEAGGEAASEGGEAGGEAAGGSSSSGCFRCEDNLGILPDLQ